jgi:hypothetical protein
MLKGFEDITQELNEEEQKLAEFIRDWIKLYCGKDKAVTNQKLTGALYNIFNKPVYPSRMRKIIAAVRRHYQPRLIANSKGYFIAQDEGELNDWIISMKQRVSQQMLAIQAAEAELEKMRAEPF